MTMNGEGEDVDKDEFSSVFGLSTKILEIYCSVSLRFSPSIFYSVSSPIRFRTLLINPGGTFPVPLSIFHTSVSRSRAPLRLNRLVTLHADSSNPWNYQEFQGSGEIPRLEETVKSRFDFERFLNYKNIHTERHDRPPCRLLTSAI